MSTTKQIQASHANGARSKGPVTAQGKHNSSRNSTRHGLLAETIVLQAEKADEFLEFLKELFEEHQPQTPTEAMLVDTIAAASWRQSRIWGMQKVAFDHDVASPNSETDSNPLRAVMALRTSPENIRTHELMLRYEIAFDRQISRSLLRLQQLQERRAKSVEEPIPPHSVLREMGEGREKVTAFTPAPAELPIAPPPPPPETTENPPAKRTQQPVEKAALPVPVSAHDPQSRMRQNLPSAPSTPPAVAAPVEKVPIQRADSRRSGPRAGNQPTPSDSYRGS